MRHEPTHDESRRHRQFFRRLAAFAVGAIALTVALMIFYAFVQAG